MIEIRRTGRRAAPVALCGLLLLGLAAGTAAARPAPAKSKQKIQGLRQRLKTLLQRTHAQRVELRETKQDRYRLADALNQSYQRVENANAALAEARNQIREAELRIARIERELAEAQARLDEQEERFGKRLRIAYMEGPATLSSVLLGARDLSDFMDRQYYVQQIAASDAELLSGLRTAQEAVERKRDELLREKAGLEEIERRRAELLEEAQEQAEEQARLMRKMQQEQALQEQRLSELEEDSSEVEQDLAAELARRSALPGGGNLPRWSGRLSQPAAGRITSGFGYRTHPILGYRRMHSGIDIGAPTGTPVMAAADGEVYFASWRGGYGRCIILLHGDGMQTLYGHLSAIQVSPGQQVRRGQRIGSVGSTGLSSGPHLHFELRRNGVPVNPR